MTFIVVDNHHLFHIWEFEDEDLGKCSFLDDVT
jgi:hypothetical protein